jgi:hypothetical protein
LAGRSWQHLNGGKPVAKVNHWNAREKQTENHKPKGFLVSLETILRRKQVKRLRIRRYGVEPSQVRPVEELKLYEGFGLTGKLIDNGTKWAADFESCQKVGYQTMLVILETEQ